MFFFLPRQMPFDRAPMHGHTKLLLNACDQFGDGQRWRCRAVLEDELQNGGREFVRSVRAALAGNQSREALLRNRLLGLVEHRTRQPERCCRLRDGSFVDLDAAKHLVLDLEQVVRIEELPGLEQRIRDSLRMRIEDALVAKALKLCRISPGWWHGKVGQLFCTCNYAA